MKTKIKAIGCVPMAVLIAFIFATLAFLLNKYLFLSKSLFETLLWLLGVCAFVLLMGVYIALFPSYVEYLSKVLMYDFRDSMAVRILSIIIAILILVGILGPLSIKLIQYVTLLKSDLINTFTFFWVGIFLSTIAIRLLYAAIKVAQRFFL